MIRLISCIRRKPEVSPEEFQRFWNDPQFQTQINNLASALNAIRGVKLRTLHVEANLLAKEIRGTEVEPFDGTIEYWWKNAGDLQAKIKSSEVAQALDLMKRYQEQFVDDANCSVFFTEADA